MSRVTLHLKKYLALAAFLGAVFFFAPNYAFAAGNLNMTTGTIFGDVVIGTTNNAAAGIMFTPTTTQRLDQISFQVRRGAGSISTPTDGLQISIYRFTNTSTAPAAYPLSIGDPAYYESAPQLSWTDTPSSYAIKTWTFSNPVLVEPGYTYQIWIHRTGTHTPDNYWEVLIYTTNSTPQHTITRRFGAFELTGSVFSGQMFYVNGPLTAATGRAYDNSNLGPPTAYYELGHIVDPDNIPTSYSTMGVQFLSPGYYQTKHLVLYMGRLRHSWDYGNIYAKVYTPPTSGTGRGTQIATSTALTGLDFPLSNGDPLGNLAPVTFEFASTLTFETSTPYNIIIEPENYGTESSTNPVYPALTIGVRENGDLRTPLLHNDPLRAPSLTSNFTTSTFIFLSDNGQRHSVIFSTLDEFAHVTPGGSSAILFDQTPTSTCQFKQWKLNLTFGQDSDFACNASQSCTVNVSWNTVDGNTTSYRLANPDVALSGDVRGLSDFAYYMPTKFSFATNTVYNARAYLCKKANATDCRLDLNTPNGNIIAYSENYRFTVTDQGACSSTLYESPGEAVRTSTNPYQDTALSDLYDQALEQCDQYGSDIPIVGGIVTGICRVLVTLVIPSQGSFDKLISLRAAVANKPPFAYFSVFSTTISSLESATSTASVISTSSASFVSNVQAYTNFTWYQTYQTIIRALLWIAFAFGIYKFFKHFTPNS